jgi:hypothetical protein
MTDFIQKIIAHLGMTDEKYAKSWLIGYFLLLLAPWMLIFCRGGADGITVVISALFLWRSLKLKNFLWTQDCFLRVAMAAWLWLMLVVSPFAEYPVVSFENALVWVRYILFYAAIRHWLLTKAQPLLYLSIMLSGLLGFCALDTLWQYITGISFTGHPINESGRLSGPMSKVTVGMFMGKLLIPASGLLLFFANQSSKKTLISALFFIIFCYTIIMLSGERTAFVATSLGLFSMAGLLAISDKKLRGGCIALLMIGITGAGLLLWTQSWLQLRLQYTITNLSDFKNSSYGQLFWVGYELGKNHLLTGVGLKGFRELCLPFLANGQVNHCNLHPHNPYIEWFAEAGAAGLAFFIAMILMLLREVAKFFRIAIGYQKLIPATALAACIVNFLPLAATQSFFSNWPAILLWLSIGIGFSAHNLLQPRPQVSQ